MDNPKVMAFTLGGCAYVVKEMFTRGMQDRTGEEQFEDARIDVLFLQKIKKINGDLIYDVNVDVWRGRVMLTGVVDDPKLLDTLTRLTGEDGQVKAVYNEIQLVLHREKGELENTISPFQGAEDFLIALDIKTKLFSDDSIKSVNYHIRSVLNRVFIIGVAKSNEEVRRVLQLIRNASGVKSVKDFIDVVPQSAAVSKF